MLQSKAVKAAATAIFWLAVWQLLSMAVGRELLLPSPSATAAALARLAVTAEFWTSAVLSLLRIFSGFLAGVTIGCLLAAATSFSKTADMLLSPIIRVIRAAPVASFIILALLWLGHNTVPAFISMLMVIPIVWGNICTGIGNTPKQLLEMAQVYQFNRRKKLTLIYIPAIFPHFSSACLTAMGLAWKSGIAAEVLCLPRHAIGSSLYYSKLYIETPDLFAWTALVIIMSLLLEKLFKKFFDKLTARRRKK